jgi:cell wall-associated NlpC family hydrolase
MTRHPAARLSLHGAITAGWTVLAAIGMAGIASTPATTSPGQATIQTVLAASTSFSVSTAVTAPVAPVAESTPVGVARNSSAVTTAAPADRAVVALRAALAEIGLPYVWGGDGPTHGDAGFDCSGLTQFAYAAAGITLPRTAHTQFYAGPHVPTGAPLQPGDLVFYGTPSRVHHVGLYVGGGRMVNAPTFGEPVQVAYYRWLGDDYVGATRPDPSSIVNLGALPFIPQAAAPAPAAARPGSNDAFVAPRAPLPAHLPVLGAIAVPEAQSAAAAISEEHQAGLAPLAATVPTPKGQKLTTSGPAPVGQTASSEPAGAALRSVPRTTPTTSPIAAPPVSPSAPPDGLAAPPTAPSMTVPATTTETPTTPTTVAATVTGSSTPPAPVAAPALPTPAAPVVPAAPITDAVPAPKTPPAPKKAPAAKKAPTAKAATTRTTTTAAPVRSASPDPEEITTAKPAAPAAIEPDSSSAVTMTPKPTTTPDS